LNAIYGPHGTNEVTFLTVYIINPHPNASISPYKPGWQEWWEASLTTGMSIDNLNQDNPLFQPKTFKERVNQAKCMIEESRIASIDLLTPAAFAPITTPVLIDDMDNRVWATYGYMPNCAYLIGKDGTVKYRENWHGNRNSSYYAWPGMKQAIETCLGH
jgi:hypothetical protein